MLPNSIRKQDLGQDSSRNKLEGNSSEENRSDGNSPKGNRSDGNGSRENQADAKQPRGSKQKEKVSNVLDALGAMFKRLELSDDQKLLASKYYTISMQRELCDNDSAFSIHVWKRAQSDVCLAEALSFVDGLLPPALEGVSLISQNKDVRTYLSEHVVVLAEEKLNVRRGTHNNLSVNRSDTAPYVTMICPDGSGIVNKRLHRGSYIRLDDDNSAEVCDRCQAKLSDHVRFIGADNIGGARDDSSDVKHGNWEGKETMPG